MSCEYKCDGCGAKAKGVFWPKGDQGWHKPDSWFQRQDKEGPQDACCRACIEKVSRDSNKTAVVAPF